MVSKCLDGPIATTPPTSVATPALQRNLRMCVGVVLLTSGIRSSGEGWAIGRAPPRASAHAWIIACSPACSPSRTRVCIGRSPLGNLCWPPHTGSAAVGWAPRRWNPCGWRLPGHGSLLSAMAVPKLCAAVHGLDSVLGEIHSCLQLTGAGSSVTWPAPRRQGRSRPRRLGGRRSTRRPRGRAPPAACDGHGMSSQLVKTASASGTSDIELECIKQRLEGSHVQDQGAPGEAQSQAGSALPLRPKIAPLQHT